ncbi:hypothetical protein HELRODRAFT_173956 [Helobdella robusta]|uniref:Uncharacterized protein n=1 Tax=Helobdella robusta TaxID=6412 RepID=T1F7E9_HELRO|nr:hypothetical protein HELRODRAFT_173956 [Helobdella robusta]ESO03076.1 hypothetical protein HELRODRAFT_173956 [Helobdella robusta]
MNMSFASIVSREVKKNVEVIGSGVKTVQKTLNDVSDLKTGESNLIMDRLVEETTDATLRHVGLNHDLTIEQRKEIKTLTDEAKLKENLDKEERKTSGRKIKDFDQKDEKLILDTVLYSEEEQSGDEKVDVEYKPDYDKDKPHMITQGELSDLVRDLGLTKNKAELLGSRLQQWNLLDRGTKISHFRDRHTEFAKFYNKEDNICYCVDIAGLMTKLDDEYDPVDWRLFIDSSKVSLKAVLLHNGNVKPSIPVAHAVVMKETYESMKTLLKVIKYTDHNWDISGDLKVVALLLGMQLGYTKHMGFLCLWNSRDDANHYLVKDWPARIDPVPGQFNILHESLVNPDKIFLPPLHIKLGIFKNFVKALPTDSKGFIYLKDKFKTTLTNAKIAAGVFTGPQIREVIRDPNFKLQLEPVELLAWKAFVALVQNFLGNHRSEDYVNLVENFIMVYQNMGCRMSLKIHFLHSHLSFFPANLGAVSDEQGERFHQEISVMEHRYQGRFDSNTMGDFCWFLQRESESQYKRKRSLSTNYSY